MSESRLNGVVKWFNSEKGYGFIVVNGYAKDIFVHRQQMIRSGIDELIEGDKVSFIENAGQKGKFATNITKET